MQWTRSVFAVLCLALCQPATMWGQDRDADAIWQQIASYFSPPPELKGKLADLPSPLLFADGSPVKTPEDWQKRRQQILEDWHRLLGPWPEIMTDQQLEVLESSQSENFTQHRVRFQFTPRQSTEGYLLVPNGAQGKLPAVVTVYYEPETAIGLKGEDRDFALQLARRGFVTLSVGLAEASANQTYAIYYPSIENAQLQPLSAMAYAAANAYHVLANRPEVDPDRVGIVGHSFGGKWAMFASCLYDRWACAAWSDGGIILQDDRSSINYWEPWYLGYEAGKWRKRGMQTEDNPAHGLYPKLRRDGRNLQELHALMAPRPFLVSGGSEDPVSRWEVLNHTVAVNRLLGFENRIAMTNRPMHSPTPESNEVMYLFFEYFLKERPDLLKKQKP